MDSIIPQKAPQDKPHYVYTLGYPESMGGCVFYIGKGRGGRIANHEQNAKKGSKGSRNSQKEDAIRKIWDAGEQVVKKKIAYFATDAEAIDYEIALIFFMRGYEHLANVLDGRIGSYRNPPSEESRRKMSEASKGRTLSAEHRQRISESRKLNGFSAEHRNKITESLKGKKPSDETRRKMSESQRIVQSSQEHLTKRKEALIARGGVSEETRRKLSESTSRYWAKKRHTQQLAFDF